MQGININYLLERLAQHLVLVNSPVLDLLNDGIQLSAARNLFGNLNIEIPELVLELYNWRNGLNEEKAETSAFGELYFLPLGMFSSIETSIGAYSYYAVSNSFWDRDMFPLFESGGGTYKMIWFYSPSQVEFNGLVAKYDSLESLVFSVTECFKQKAYYYTRSEKYPFAEGPYFEFDAYKEAQISQRYNPNSEYWQLFS